MQFAPILNCFAQAMSCDMIPHADGDIVALHSEIRELFSKCKTLARMMKMPSRISSDLGLVDPPQSIADNMCASYIEYVGPFHRLFHVPSFWAEYQRYRESPETTPTSTRLKVLLV